MGTLSVFDSENIRNYFRRLYLTKVKDTISSYLVHKQISLLEINAYFDELSEHLKNKIEPVMLDYGLQLIFMSTT